MVEREGGYIIHSEEDCINYEKFKAQFQDILIILIKLPLRKLPTQYTKSKNTMKKLSHGKI